MSARAFRQEANELLASLGDPCSGISLELGKDSGEEPCYEFNTDGMIDLIYTIRIWDSRMHMEPKIIQECEFEGESPISSIFDRLHCLAKFIEYEDEQDSVTMFVGNQVYGDMPPYLKQWKYELHSLDSFFELRVFNPDTKMVDVPFELNTKYLILHGDCGHVFKVTEIRLKTLQDNATTFPLNLYQKKFGFLVCSVCTWAKASRAVKDGYFTDPWCQRCFNDYYKGKPVESHKFVTHAFLDA